MVRYTFIDVEASFPEEMRALGHEGLTVEVEQLHRVGKAFASPSNSRQMFDGGIDWPLSREMFLELEPTARRFMARHGRVSLLGRRYLPIGAAAVHRFGDSFVICAPTMLLPGCVRDSRNAYHAMRAIKAAADAYLTEYPGSFDEVYVPGLCCGCGMMLPAEAARQVHEASRGSAEGFRVLHVGTSMSVTPTDEVLDGILAQQPKDNTLREYVG